MVKIIPSSLKISKGLVRSNFQIKSNLKITFLGCAAFPKAALANSLKCPASGEAG
jgi:hypothetical protein